MTASRPVSSDVGTSTPEVLEIGVGWLEQKGEGYSFEAAAKHLVGQFLADVHPDRLPVRGILLLATADWCRTTEPLCKKVRREIHRHLGYRPPLIGGSMAKLFCSKAKEVVIEHGVVLVAFCSRDFWMTAELLERPHKNPDGRRLEVRKLAQRIENKAGVRLGASALRHLLGIFPGTFRDEQGQLQYWDHELHEEIRKAFSFHYPLIGAAAANDLDPTVGYQFADDKCCDSSLALAIVESDLAWGTRMGHGFVADRELCVAVDALKGGAEAGYEVETLDGKPAAERLRELQNTHTMAGGPVCFGLATGEDYYVVRAFDTFPGESGNRVRLTRRVRRGDRLYVLRGRRQILDGIGRSILKGARESADAPRGTTKLVWGMTCKGRLSILQAYGLSWKERVQDIAAVFPGVPMIGGLCGGEFGVDQRGQAQANTFSVWASCIASAYSKPAKNRDLQRKLIGAAEQLSRCGSAREVMETALREAIRAGALGGQICLVDHKIGKIIGRNVGCALSAANQPTALAQAWENVASRTLRDIPEQVGGQFPLNLVNYAIQLDLGVALEMAFSIPKEEDILTLITRTRSAVLVTDAERMMDAHKSFFHCDPSASKAGNVRRFLAIPLIGSGGNVIATLQIGFRLDISIDRESFALWVGFGQKLAAALERAQEAEERKALEKITAVANRIMQKPSDPTLPEFHWCFEYLQTVREAVGADDIHMRILHMIPTQSKEFCLAGAAGFLAKRRKQTRPVTHEGDGSCCLQLLRHGGRIENTVPKIRRLNLKVRPIVGSDRARSEFERQLALVRATALIPVCDQNLVLGSFVVDSKQEYFFTERCQRIVSSAANLAGAVLSNRRTALAKARMDQERKWILDTLGTASGTKADDSLRVIAARMADAFGAHAASLYLWHDTFQKLVLHIAHRWRSGRTLEGKANYKLGEQWIGSLGRPGPMVRIDVRSSGRHAACLGKYDAEIIPHGRTKPAAPGDARMGVRLAAGDQLVGVLSFDYRCRRTEMLFEHRNRVEAIASGLAPVLTVGLQAARQEIVRRRITELHAAETRVADAILEAASSDGDWQSVMNSIRDELRVERAAYYVLRDQELVCDCFSLAPGSACVSPPDCAIKLIGSLRRVLAGKTIVFGENQEPLQPHSPLWAGAKGVILSPVSGKHGKVAGVLELVNRRSDRDHPFPVFDIPDQRTICDVARSLGVGILYKHDELSLREYMARVENASRLGAASLSGAMGMHHILQPISRIQSAADWFRMHPDGAAPDKSERLDQIEAAVAEAYESVELLSDEGPPMPREINLRILLRQVFHLIQPQIPPTGLDLSIDNDLAVNLRVNPPSIVEALLCLVSNALESVGQNGSLGISTMLNTEKSRAIIRIENSGPKYSGDEIARFRLPGFTTKGRKRHLGMGMTIASKAVEMAHGSLDMQPRAGGGIVTLVSLPVPTQHSAT